MTMVRTLEPCGIFGPGMQNSYEASPSIILAGLALLVKRLTTLVPHRIFSSNFACLYSFKFS